MGARDVLFIGLVVSGAATLTALLFSPPERPTPVGPEAVETRTPEFHAVVERVDATFHGQWLDNGLEPAPPAPELAVVRRLSLALTGAIPSVQELRQLEAVDPAARFDWWLNSRLEDRRFADYFAERFARACVGTENGPFVVFRRSRFVSWLSDQLMANRPFDEVVRELIASNGLWTDKPATNFITVTIEPANKKGPDPVRLAGRVARTFLGVRFDCAQCHNHPFAPWKQSEFEGLAAFFGQTRQGFTGIYDDPAGTFEVEDRVSGKMRTVEPCVPFHPDLLPEEGTSRERLAAWLTDTRNPYLPRAVTNRVWALLFGRPLVEPVDDVNALEDVPEALRLLADDFVRNGYDLRRLIRLIASTEVFHLDSAAPHELHSGHDQTWAAFPMTRLRPEQIIGGLLQSSYLETVDRDSHFFVRFFRFVGERQFVERYGDTGEDEFDGRGGTIPQRLLLMNGEVVKERTKQDLFNAASRIAFLAPDDDRAVETAYLAVLTRRPGAEEASHFATRLADAKGDRRAAVLEDLYWTLLNSTEFAWNH